MADNVQLKRLPKVIREDNKRRVARMTSWIGFANAAADSHEKFVPYWLAFEAAHARASRFGNAVGGRGEGFLRRIAKHDAKCELPCILREHRTTITRLFGLRYAHPAFWYQNRSKAKSVRGWEREFSANVDSAKAALVAAVSGDVRAVAQTLETLFDILYVVRNQVMHGGSAGGGSRSKSQVDLAVILLSALIPCFRKIVKSHENTDWGRIPFPRVEAGSPPLWLR